MKLLDIIREKLSKQAKRFIEPFLGAGAISLNVSYPEHIVSDINRDLINVWKFLKWYGAAFIDRCEDLFTKANNNEEKYYALRDEFNTVNDEFRKAILFIYLNRHCFNGLCRYNSRGIFNSPFGNYKHPYFPKTELEKAHKKIQNFQIMCTDFRDVFNLIEPNDIVYCDPPYLPLSESSNFTSYSREGFSLQDQIDLACCAQSAAKKGATVLISNHYNWYSHQIYSVMCNGKYSVLNVSRTISSDTTNRKPVKEILAIFNTK